MYIDPHQAYDMIDRAVERGELTDEEAREEYKAVMEESIDDYVQFFYD